MGGEEHCRALLHEAAREADLILIEGVMGLFDGTPSSADLAQLFGIPVLAVIDAESMAQSFGAITHGLATYRKELPIAGVLANRVAGARRAEMTEQGMPPGVKVAAHKEVTVAPQPILSGMRIGGARERAFSFLYHAYLDLLSAMGAELAFFSPLADAALPEVDSVYLPGGYPELHLSQLSANLSMAAALRRHVDAGKPVYAECGGMLYLLESLTDVKGQRADMTGIVPGTATMLFWFLL